MWEKLNERKITAGLLLSDVPVLISFEDESFATYPYTIILTQACDIQSYYKSIEKWKKINEIRDRQLITQIIFCPAFEEEHFINGTHLESQYKYKMPKLTSKQRDKYKNLEHIRYYYIPSNEKSIPNLFLDFKQYFTLPVTLVNELIKGHNNLYKLDHLLYTHLADRFAFYLQRVALPSQNT